MPAADAIVALTDAFNAQVVRPDGTSVDRSTVVMSWPSVPVEIVRAAGLRPAIVRGGPSPTALAEEHLEAGVFPNRLRHLVEMALSGRLAHAAGVVVPRTSDADYRCFLYLRELTRRGAATEVAPVHLFDLLQSGGDHIHDYNTARTRGLFDLLSTLGEGGSREAVREQVVNTNTARAALRRLVALRSPVPRITGSEALPLLGAFWSLAPLTYTMLASAAADSIARRPPLDGPRVLLVGAPVDGQALHRAIETLGAVVVAESSPWGTGAAEDDVADERDPFAAIAAKYSRDATGPRASVDSARRWVVRASAAVDAVVVSLPPDDAVFGWDYPWLRAWLDAHEVPHVCLSHDPGKPMADRDQARLEALVSEATSRLEVRRG